MNVALDRTLILLIEHKERLIGYVMLSIWII